MMWALADLLTIKTQLMQALSAVLVAGQSYSVAGKSFTKADLKVLSEMLGSVNAAIAVKTGQTQRFVYADMSSGA